MRNLFKELVIDEIQLCFQQLEAVGEAHITWVERLHEALVCADSGDLPADLTAADAHRQCSFGRWYYRDHHPLLDSYPEFQALGGVHQGLHQWAATLLGRLATGVGINRDAYHRLNTHLAELRRAFAALESRLKASLSEFSKLTTRVFDSSAEGVLITDAYGTILNVNKAFTRLTGYGAAEVIGKSPQLLKSGRHGADFYAAMWHALHHAGSWQGEIWNRRKNGEVYPEWLTISVVRNDAGDPAYYVGMFSDISLAKENERRLDRLAHYDPLTELPNRALFHERLEQSLATAKRNTNMVALLFLDLDRFKMVNDTLGHNAGDALLVEVAHRLRGCVRHSDTAARLSGDEFVVILNEVDSIEGAKTVAAHIVERLARPFRVMGREVFVTVSIGIAISPLHGEDVRTLVKAADLAMYDAKEQGRNNFKLYRRGINAAASRLFEMENSLRRALEREEFRLFYQPQVDIEDGSIIGMEALLRWQHPTEGLIMPAEFIPLAEETGLIVAIGEWVLRTACVQTKRWHQAGMVPFPISVNLSTRQLRQRDLAERVAAVLDDSGLEPERLRLELTETAVLQNPDEAAGLLRQLKSMGVWISIDDFGTGYSGLNYLKRFPVDAIKIDKSFIHGVVDNNNDQAIAKAIIALAHALGLEVLAEGVENTDQLSFLRDNKCCDAQGYLFSRPVPVEAATAILESRVRLF